MRSIKKFLYIFLAIICVLTGPGMVIVYHFYLAPTLGTIEVVKIASEVQRGNIITDENLVVKKVKMDEVVEGAFTDTSEVIGKEARYNLKRGQQIIPDMIDDKGLYPNNDQWNTSIPIQWIYAMPGSLLRGDRVTLYAVEVKDNELKVDGADGVPGITQELLQQMNNGGSSSGKKESTSALQAEIVKRKGVKVIDGIVVSFAKASNNIEVTTPEENRLKPSGPVTALEVIVNQQQWDKIVEYPLKGYKYIVMYK